jgi:hypothetical protein
MDLANTVAEVTEIISLAMSLLLLIGCAITIRKRRASMRAIMVRRLRIQ